MTTMFRAFRQLESVISCYRLGTTIGGQLARFIRDVTNQFWRDSLNGGKNVINANLIVASC
jgi:hypothetical protein